MPAGYSGTPLIRKLGIDPRHRILLLNPPDGYKQWLDTDISGQVVNPGETPDLVHLFAADQKVFLYQMKKLESLRKKNPKIIIWVSWYKKSTGIRTDLDEETIRQYALKNDLVDVKVCAVSDQWSGLKLVVPLSKRS
jgi:hypothetical protein